LAFMFSLFGSSGRLGLLLAVMTERIIIVEQSSSLETLVVQCQRGFPLDGPTSPFPHAPNTYHTTPLHTCQLTTAKRKKRQPNAYLPRTGRGGKLYPPGNTN
jgi:hypothetical protein